jgi:hypothetical protein
MDPADRQQFLRDAKTLAWYAARNSKLPPGCNIFERIEEFGADSNPSTQLITQLQKEMNDVSSAIAPTTLRHLLQRGTVVDYVRHVLSGTRPFVLGLLTLLLTLYLAFQSSQLNEADTAIREYQTWVDQQPREKLYDAWKMYRYERVLNLKGPPLAQLDAYHKLEDDARQLVEKGETIRFMLSDAGRLLYVPRLFYNIGPFTGLQDFFHTINNEGLVNGAGPNNINIPKDLPPSPDVQSMNSVQQPDGAGYADLASPLDCKDSVLSSDVSSVTTKIDRQRTDVEDYMNSVDCFFLRLHIAGNSIAHTPWSYIYQVKAKINLLVTWLLPGLYGLLGACVYLLRELVFRHGSKLSEDRRIVGTLLLPLRIALGGLAGIIIGWFWIPGSIGNSNSAVIPISSVPFGLAFMAGYSIDTLFLLLDRVKRTIDTSDVAERKSGVTETRMPERPYFD